MKKTKKCEPLTRNKREKTRQGKVIGGTFEVYDEEAMELLTFQTVEDGCRYCCSSKCDFRLLQSKTAEHEDLVKETMARNFMGIGVIKSRVVGDTRTWPCYLHSCRPCEQKEKPDGTLVYGTSVHYKLIGKQKTGEIEDEDI